MRVLLVALILACAVGCTATAKRRAKAPTTQVSEPARQRFKSGVAHMDEGATGYNKAIKDFQAAAAATPDLWEAWLNIGVIELRRARLAASARAFEKSIEIYASSEALEGLGEVYLRQGRAKKAVKLYVEALEKNPRDGRLRTRLAVSLRHAGRLDEAEAELRAVLGNNVGDPVAYATLAAIKMDREQYDLAELVLNKGLEKNPEEPSLLTNLGLVALRRGDDQQAFVLFERASQADPNFLAGRLNKAAVYLGAGDHSRAKTELDAVLKVEPGNAQALLGVGVAQRMAGDHTAARSSWEQVLRLDPENAAAHFNLAVLEMDFADKPADARAHLEQYLQLAVPGDPRIAPAKERLQLVKALAKG